MYSFEFLAKHETVPNVFSEFRLLFIWCPSAEILGVYSVDRIIISVDKLWTDRESLARRQGRREDS